jgi:signal transduction histidine kinase
MRQLEEAAAQLEDEHALSSDIAAAAERAKMARELHDAVAHCMSVMVVQTSGARRVASSDLGAARDALWAVEHAGREALVELRRIVGVLYRSDDDEVGSGTPGLAHLDALADRARAAGLPVELQMDGRRRPLSPGLELATYRVVQEALTNAIKHAGPAEARVLLTFGPRELELRVCDSGRGPASGSGDGSGHGLVGMSERVRLYGGELHAGAITQGRCSPSPSRGQPAAPSALVGWRRRLSNEETRSWRPTGMLASSWRSPGSARGSPASCTRSWPTASRRW